jgi:hypothetical protein
MLLSFIQLYKVKQLYKKREHIKGILQYIHEMRELSSQRTTNSPKKQIYKYTMRGNLAQC